MSERPAKPSFGLSAAQKEKLQALLAAEGLEGDAPKASGPRPRAADAGELPLSPSQERLWFLERLSPGTAVYHVPAPLHLVGALDVDALQGALVELVGRHELLRTSFPARDGLPVQRIAAAPSGDELAVRYGWTVHDLGRVAEDGRWSTMLARVNAEYRRPFDLEEGPLVRMSLWRLGDEEHVLLLSLHHAICDAVSLGILLEDLGALYAARLGRGDAPAAPELQFADYALWLRDELAGDAHADELAWWRERLAGELPTIELPSDRPRPAVPSGQGAWITQALAPGLLARVEAFARECGATPFMVLLAATKGLLLRTTGTEDVVVASPVGARHDASLERLPGFLVNTLVLRTDLSGAPSFRELVGRVRDTALESFARQEVPFERVVQAVQPERELSSTPLFQVLFDHRRELPGGLELPGLRSSRFLGEEEVHSATTKVDLALYTEERDGEAFVSAEYSSDLFDPPSIERLLGHFGALLAAALDEPERALVDLPLCSDEERRLVLEEWNGPTPSYPQTSVARVFAAVAAAEGDSVAVRFEGRQLSYRELDRAANRVARTLVEAGVGPDVPVGLCMERSLELLPCLLGILKAGGAYVPLDPGYPKERLAFMLRDTAAPVVIGHDALLAELPRDGVDARFLAVEEHAGGWMDGPDAAAPKVELTPESLCYVTYTSGSTGRPKGVEIPHRGVLRLVFGQSYCRLGPDTTTLQLAPIAFDASTLELWGPLLNGGRVVLYPERLPTTETLGRVLHEEKVTTLWLTAALFNSVVDEAPGVLAGLRECLTGGEALSVAHVRRAYAALPPSVQLVNGYGPTESTTFACCHRIPRDLPSALPSIPIGKPIANTRVYLLDRAMQPVPPGLPGDLWIGGDGLARGYLGRDDLNAERFRPDPFSTKDGARLYRTGDRARWLADGTIEFLGRDDDQVKIRGFRIELGEIEAVLARHASVRSCAVVVHEDERAGKRLAAHVVASEGAATDTAALRAQLGAQLRAHLAESLPDYMVPAAIGFLDELPRTPNGKLDRRALPEPDFGGEGAGKVSVPRGELERLLAEQWAELLGVEGAESIGSDDDFFQLGGHSLLATALLARVRALFGVELSLRAFFRGPTVGAIAREIEAARGTDAEAADAIEATPLPADGVAELSLNQRGLWFLQKLAPDSAFYNVPVALRLTGALDVDALERALTELVRRHEALRTSFPERDGEPVALVGPVALVEQGALDWRVEDLRSLPEGERGKESERLAREEATRPFDVENGPLLRTRLLRRTDDDATLVLNAHHLVVDGWSLDVLVRELTQTYEALGAGGDTDPLGPPPAVQPRHHALWQRARLAGARREAELDWWRRTLDGAPLLLELPTDRPRPAVAAYGGASVRRALPDALAAGVRALGRRHGTTVFMTALAATEVLLSRWARQDDFVLGTPVAARTRPELEAAVGLFLNIVPLRADVAGSGEAPPSFVELLGRVRERVLAAHAHQELPFEALVDEFRADRDLSTSPIYQVLFSVRSVGTPVTIEGGGDDALTVHPPVDVATATSKTDLAVTFDDDGAGLVVDLTYDPALFERGTMEALARRFELVLASAVRAPETGVHELETTSEEDRRLVLETWNGPRPSYPRTSIPEVFADVARRSADAPAVSFRGETLSYRELDERSNRIARRLRKLGVGAETRVGLCMDRGPELLPCVLGILKAGGAYVPLDPSYPAERLAFMVEDAAAPIVLAHGALTERLPVAGPVAAAGPRIVRIDEEWAAWMEESAEPLSPDDVGALGPESLAYVMYTSGSTGRPKGVEVPHRAVLRLVFGQDFARLGPETVTLQLAPLAFDASTLELWGALLHGGRVALYPERLPTTEALGAVLAEERVTTLWLTAALFNAVVDEDPTILAGLTDCLAGGEALSVPHIRKAYAALPESVQLVNGYGPTENTTFTCCHRIPRDLPADTASIPIGRPIANTSVYVFDDTLQPVPPGVPGELWTGGDGLARGYLGRAELNAERFRPDPFSSTEGARIYSTGDLVRWLPDGTLEFRGRTDDQVKIRGHRIEPGETRAVLAEHTGVGQAHVGVHEDGKAGKRLVAWVAPAEGATLDADDLARHLSERLPDYMVPSAFVLLERLPVNANGKVDRSALPEPDFRGAAEHVAPKSEVERHLATIWEHILGVADVGLHDDFFDLGGHSLLAVKLLADVKDVFGQELPLTSLISAPTIYDQGQLLHEGVGSADSSCLVKIQPKGTRPPVFCVCSLGGTVLNQRPLAVRLGDDQPFYGLQAIDLSSLDHEATIEDYAARYLETIRAVRPHGPYVIGGHSFGGVVAYELAQQLRAAGEEVGMLFILDSALPNLETNLGDKVGSVLAFLRGLPHVPAEAVGRFRRDPEQLKRDVRQKLHFTKARLRSLFGQSGPTNLGETPPATAVTPDGKDDSLLLARNAGLDTADIVEMSHWPENNRRIAMRHYRAVLAYEPKPYDGRITLFRSRLQSPFLGLGLKMGWERVARGGVEVLGVPGGHLSILAPPHVDVLAEKMRRALAGLRERGERRGA